MADKAGTADEGVEGGEAGESCDFNVEENWPCDEVGRKLGRSDCFSAEARPFFSS